MIFGSTHHFVDDCKNFLAATFQTVEYGIFSSPDSDDTFPGEESEDVSMRDDQFLVADRSENKFYGTVRGGSTPAGAGPSLGNIGRKLQVNIHTVTLSLSKEYYITQTEILIRYIFAMRYFLLSLRGCFFDSKGSRPAFKPIEELGEKTTRPGSSSFA